MSTLRLRRLAADFDKLRNLVDRNPRLKLLQASGEPPEMYQIEYKIRSLRQTNDDLTFVGKHTVEIVLPRDYPRMPPQCRMLTPVFHPNIAPHAICVGDHWSAGEPIGSIVARIGEMLAYQSYNTKSPLNGEAARWVEQNLDQLPLDKVNMAVESSSAATVPAAADPAPRSETSSSEARSSETSRRVKPALPVEPRAQTAAAAPRPAPAVAESVSFACPQCHERYKASAELQGKRTRCKKCQAIITIPAPAPEAGP